MRSRDRHSAQEISKKRMAMRTTYYKDTIRSYMIIECPAEAETRGYQYRMLEMNRIEGLLSCGIRHIDGVKYLYYDITGKQSLQALYEARKIPGTELFKLLKAVDAVSESLSGYLLDEQKLVLTADQIFYDLRTGSYWFTYYPGSSERPELFRFLADSIDGTDKRAAAAAYRLCSLAGGSRLALREALREEASEEAGSRENYLDVFGPKDSAAEREAPGLQERRYEKEAEMLQEKRPEKGEPEEPEEKEKSGKWRFWVRILFIVLLSSGAGGLIAVQYFMYISQRERRLCIAGTILLLIAAVMLTAETILRSVKRRKQKEEEEKKRTPVYMKSDEAAISASTISESREAYMISDDNNTVRFSEQDTVGRLYGRDRGNRIDLRTLPVTIGKAQAYADVILDDPSVSRLHARIYRGEDGAVEIKDLGSTNGTFINGIRIPPNEKSTVQRGDEVKFGTLEYEYR